MKITDLLRPILFAGLLLPLATWVQAQEATLSSATRKLTGAGDLVTVQATVRYAQTPGAIGWTLECPAAWELVAVGGPNVPEIRPEAKATGVLEFAFTSTPEKSATFEVTVKLPLGVTQTKIQGKAIVRQDSKRVDVTAAPLVLPRE